MKAKIGPTELEVEKEDYDALQKVSNMNIFKIISDEFAFFRLLNLMRISKIFEKKCKEGGFNPQKITPKFLARFIDAASYEEDEDLQEMWANLLISESNDPDSNSLRTIETLKNLSKDEALKFDRLCKKAIIVGKDLVICNDIGDDKSLEDIIELVDSGLLVSDNTMITVSIKLEPKTKKAVSISHDKTMAIFAENSSESLQKFKIPVFSLTKAGNDIFKANILEKMDRKSYIDNATFIKQKNPNLKITLHNITKYSVTNIDVDSIDLLGEAKK